MDRCTCPSPEQLSDLLRENLSTDEHSCVATHLEDCSVCQNRLDQLVAADCVESWRALDQVHSEPQPDQAFISSLKSMIPQAVVSASQNGSIQFRTGLVDSTRLEDITEAPTKIGDYEIIDEIARGGMAIVYRARQPQLGRIVAIKRLRFRDQERADVERFFLEAESVARLHHPYIVQVFQVGEDLGRPYLALEYIHGPTLAEHLSGSPVDPRSAAEFLRKVAIGVHHAHQQGIIHRDLKPANILLDPIVASPDEWSRAKSGNGTKTPLLSAFEPKVADFGLARRIDDEQRLTLPDVLAGTPAYLAPEQITRGTSKVTIACDIYSLGAILYEMLTGRPPHLGPTVLATIRLVESADPIPPRRLQPAVPRDLESVCMKCLAKEPTRRYASAAQLAADLLRFREGKPTAARPVSLLARFGKLIRRHPFGAGAALTVVLAAGFGLAGILWQWHEAEVARTQLQVSLDAEAEQRRDAEENLYYGRLAQAVSLWDSGEAAQARQLLAACRPAEGRTDLRGWEWHYLNRQFRPELRVDRFSHWINGLSLVPSSASKPQELALAIGRPKMNQLDRVLPNDGLAGFLSYANASSVFRPGPPLSGAATAVAVHPSKGIAAWATNTGQIIVSDVATASIVTTIQAPTTISSLAFTTGGNLAATCLDAHLRVYQTTSGALLRDETVRVGRPWALAVQAKGPLVACGGLTGTVRLFNSNTWERIGDLTGHREGAISLCFSPDETRLAVGCHDGAVVLWDTATRKELRRIPSQGGPAYAIAYRPDGLALAIGGADRTVRICDLTSERVLNVYRGHESTVRSIVFTADGERLVTGGQDGSVRVWDASKEIRGRLIPFHDRLNDAAFCHTPEGLLVVAASGNGSINAWAARDGRLVSHQSVPLQMRAQYPRRYMAFSSQGRRLVGIERGNGRQLAAWSSTTGEPFTLAPAESGDVQAVTADWSGRAYAWASQSSDGSITIHYFGHDAGSQPLSISLPIRSVMSLVIDATHGQIAVVAAPRQPGGDVSVWICDPSGTIPAREITRGRSMFGGLAFSPDGRLLAISCDDGVQVYRSGVWQCLATIAIPPGSTSLAFSPDGRRLAAVGYDGHATLVDPVTGKRVFQLRSLARSRPDEMASDARVAFSPDGNWLLSTNWDGSINLWDGSPVD